MIALYEFVSRYVCSCLTDIKILYHNLRSIKRILLICKFVEMWFVYRHNSDIGYLNFIPENKVDPTGYGPVKKLAVDSLTMSKINTNMT